MKVGSHFFMACLAMTAFACTPPMYLSTAEKSGTLPEFNNIVLDIIREYPADGTHKYWWPKKGEGNYSGSTRDLYLCGECVMKGEPQKRTFCCGLTLEVFLVSYEKWLEKHGGENDSLISPDKWKRFQKLWFVLNTNGPGPSAALEEFRLGLTIEPDMALPGDFVQIWRTPEEVLLGPTIEPDMALPGDFVQFWLTPEEFRRGRTIEPDMALPPGDLAQIWRALKMGKEIPTGHSVIFLNWVRDNADKIEGMHYWSTQVVTNGIGDRTEYFGSNGGIARENTYFARVMPWAATTDSATFTRIQNLVH
ncbi:MAG: hypothetical protein Q8P51_01570 [Ignavibacteria bacterium]|nr:hypothetical protein [Ignavibacteria bacterium]